MTVIMVMIVMMVVIVIMMMVVMMTMTGGMDTLVQHPSTNRDDGQSRYRPENLRDLLRHDVLKQKHGGQAQQEHAHRMRKRHHRAQKSRVPDGAARTHQIRRHNGLAMSGSERVRRA